MNYNEMTKADLLTEAGKRKLSVTDKDTKEAIVAALVADDKAKDEKNPPPTAAPAATPTRAPRGKGIPTGPERGGTREGFTPPTDDDYNEGHYVKRDDKVVFALAIVKDDPDGKTHWLKNTTQFFHCKEGEFRMLFDPVK